MIALATHLARRSLSVLGALRLLAPPAPLLPAALYARSLCRDDQGVNER